MTNWTYQGYSPTPLSVSGRIVPGIDEGKIALPEFQRDFDWDQERIVSLLTSVARRWPVGTLLIIESEKVADLPWGRRSFDSAPLLSSPNILVLDGQQRLTSLYHAIKDVSNDVYYCNIRRVAERGELDDDDIISMKRHKFEKEYPDTSAEATNGLIKISRLFFDDRWDEWLRYIDDANRGEMIRVRGGSLAGLTERSYSIPAIRLEGEVPLTVVAKIFETTNRRPLRLDAFDLMVARLYPKDFNLREKWQEAQAKYGFPDRMALEALQVIALREHIGGARGVNGIRQSDVLELDADVVIGAWDKSVAALDEAIRFMAERCGAVRPNLIPSATMRIPLADALWDGAGDSSWGKRLRRWFWSSVVGQTYAQGANTQAVTDARALRAWRTNPDQPPTDIASLDSPDSLNEVLGSLTEALGDTRRRNQMLTLGVLCLVISRDARDWMKDRRISDPEVTDQIDVHHVFASNYVKTSWAEEANVVANFTPLFASTNRAIRSDHPKNVLGNKDISNSNVWTHRIPREAFTDEKWHAFIEGRIEMLIEAFREELSP